MRGVLPQSLSGRRGAPSVDPDAEGYGSREISTSRAESGDLCQQNALLRKPSPKPPDKGRRASFSFSPNERLRSVRVDFASGSSSIWRRAHHKACRAWRVRIAAAGIGTGPRTSALTGSEADDQRIFDHVARERGVSLPITTRLRWSPRRNARPAAWPTFSAISAVIWLLARPWMPSVPKYLPGLRASRAFDAVSSSQRHDPGQKALPFRPRQVRQGEANELELGYYYPFV